MTTDRQVLAFCHIPKTAGTTLTHFLRGLFSLRHLEVLPSSGFVLSLSDLDVTLHRFRHAWNITGHGLRPYALPDLPDVELRWYTFLRDPLRRTLSHYQHQVERHGLRITLREWLQLPQNRNWHVRMLAGQQDLGAAIKIIQERFFFVGVLEDFDRSIQEFLHRLGLPAYLAALAKPKNRARRGVIVRRLTIDDPTVRNDLEEANTLDMKLYNFVKEASDSLSYLASTAPVVPALRVPQPGRTLRCWFLGRSLLSWAQSKLLYRAWLLSLRASSAPRV